MKRFWRYFQKFNVKTIYFNLKYLPFKQAIQFPILVSNKLYLRVIAGKIQIDAPLRTGMIQIGFGDVGLFDNKKSRSIWDVSGNIIFRGNCQIGHGSKISVGEKGNLVIGKDFLVTAESTIVAFDHVEFGNNCLLSWDILIMDTDFHPIKDENGFVINGNKPIFIGNKVWIGCRTMVLKGSVIPDNTVIGANSMVTHQLEKSNSIYVGNPCKLIKEKISWEL